MLPQENFEVIITTETAFDGFLDYYYMYINEKLISHVLRTIGISTCQFSG